MAMIIEFRGHSARGEIRTGDSQGQGEIIIFPGVRRERHIEAMPEQDAEAQLREPSQNRPKRSRAKPKRDRIELPEQ